MSTVINESEGSDGGQALAPASGVLWVRTTNKLVSAMQFTGDNHEQIEQFLGEGMFREPIDTDGRPDVLGEVYNHLFHGWVGVKAGQWVFRGEGGMFFPLDDAQMKAQYEPVTPLRSDQVAGDAEVERLLSELAALRDKDFPVTN